MLKHEGYNTLETTTGIECLRLVKEHHPDMLLLDVVLPDMSGIEICRQIKNNPATKDILILLVSGLEIDNDVQVQGLDAGADSYLVKPHSNQMLLAQVRVLERIRRSEAALRDAAIALEKRTDAALKESEERYRLISSVASDYMFSSRLDRHGNLILNWVGGAFEAITEYTFEEYLSIGGWRARVFPQDREQDEKDMEALRANRNITTDIRTITKSGKVVWVRVYAHPAWDTGKNMLLGIYGAVQNIDERKRAELALRESEERYRTMIENSHDLIQSVAPDGRFFFVNPNWRHTLGYTAEDISGINLFDIIHPESLPHCRHVFEKIMAGENIPHIEVTFVAKDGRPVFLEGNAAPRLLDGKVIATQSFFHDITGRKRTEEALRESESRYRDMVEQINDVIFTTDVKGIFTYISPSVEVLGGYKPGELVGHSMNEFVDPVFLPKIKEQFVKVMAGTLEPSEYRIRIQSGEFRWVRTSSKPIMEGNKPVGMRGVITEITARKQVEETVTLLSHTVRSIAECVSITDLNNKILFVNQAFLDLYGYSESEIIGKPIGTVAMPDGADIPEIVTTTIKSGWQGEIINRKKDGTEFPISLSTSVVLDEMGKAIALVGIADDITEQKKLRQELLQSQKMESIGTLAGGIAHDFNNILNIIMGYASFLENAKISPHKRDESLAAINNAIQRGAALVRQILTFARKSDVAFGPLNLVELLRELLSMLQQTFPKTIIFKEVIEKKIPFISADRSQIHQALLNLCVNARDAMPNGGSITLAVMKKNGAELREQFPSAEMDSYLCLQVSDTGEGMTEAIRSKIFDPFFTTKEMGKGTGLGLSVVFGVVQAHHGFVDVESVLGQGTTFHLYFPVPQESEIPQIIKSQEDSLEIEGTEIILLVEDEEYLREMGHLTLESQGYQVYEAQDGLQAVEMYKMHHEEIALVLTDMGLPGLTGMDVFKAMKEINPEVKLLFMSGFVEPDVKAMLLEAGARGFIQKPYTRQELLLRLRAVLDE